MLPIVHVLLRPPRPAWKANGKFILVRGQAFVNVRVRIRQLLRLLHRRRIEWCDQCSADREVSASSARGCSTYSNPLYMFRSATSGACVTRRTFYAKDIGEPSNYLQD